MPAACTARSLSLALALLAASPACDRERSTSPPASPSAGPTPAPSTAPSAPPPVAPPEPAAPRVPEPRALEATENPAVFAFRAALWARLSEPERAQLAGIDPANTAGGNRRQLEFLAADRVTRTLVPQAFDAADAAPSAVAVRALRPITDRRSCDAALNVLTTAVGVARTSAGANAPRALDDAMRAAGHAGNACRVAAGLERGGAGTQRTGTGDDAESACDNLGGGEPRARACRRAAETSPAAARAAAAAVAVADAVGPAGRAAVLASAVETLRALVSAAQAGRAGAVPRR